MSLTISGLRTSPATPRAARATSQRGEWCRLRTAKSSLGDRPLGRRAPSSLFPLTPPPKTGPDHGLKGQRDDQ